MSPVRALLRTAHPGPCVAVTAATALLAVAADAPMTTISLVAAAVLAGQLSIGWSNDLADVARDRAVARPDKPLATGAVSVRVVRTACVLAVVACVLLSLACGWLAGSVHLVAVASAWAYNLALKSTWWSWAPYAVSFGLLPLFVSLARESAGLPRWVPLVGALLGVGAHLVNAVPDLDDDAATGVRGLPHRLGARASVVLATVLLLGASAVVAPGWRLLVVLPVAAVALLGPGRWPFRAAMVLAVLDVVLLAIRL